MVSKKLFGTESNKDLLIDFLNQLLPSHHQIEDFTFDKNEQLPEGEWDRIAIFDSSAILALNEGAERNTGFEINNGDVLIRHLVLHHWIKWIFGFLFF